MSRLIHDITESGTIDGLSPMAGGWTRTSTSWAITTDNPRTVIIDGTSYGGTYSCRGGTSSGLTYGVSPVLANGAKEHYGKMGIRVEETSGDLFIYCYDAAGTQILEISTQNLGVLIVEDSAANVVITTAWSPVVNTWYLLEWKVIHDGTNGFAEIFIDDASVGSYSGAMAVGDGNGMAQLAIGGGNTPRFDDIGINAITMRYDGGSGSAPAVGEVLTGAGGGSATVTHLLSGNATAGTVMLHLWNKTAFVDNEVLTGSTALVAVVDAPNAAFANGFEPNSGFLGNSVVLRFDPTADGNSSQLTNSAGTSVNNWSYVDDLVSTTYVEATAADQRDTYTFGGIAAALPSVANCEVPYISMHMVATATLAGIGGVKPVLRYSGTDYDGDRQALASDFPAGGRHQGYDTRPDDDETAWDATSAAAIEGGKVFVA